MGKIIKITYNPYKNEIKIFRSPDSETEPKEIGDESELIKYHNLKCVFSNCVEDIVNSINKYQNTDDEPLLIQFVGTDDDYSILERVVSIVNSGSKKIDMIVKRIGEYKSANDAIEIIRNAYKRIESEFEDYLPGTENYNKDRSYAEIGDDISVFNDIVSTDIPICVVGTYSVGKSAFINAIIGDEVLPSEVDPCTAKNVRVIQDDDYSIIFEYKSKEIELRVVPGGFNSVNEECEISNEILDTLKRHCIISDKAQAEIIHDILDLFNKKVVDLPENADIGWNITVKVPFIQSLLNNRDSRIVLYDTPGSNNSDVDQIQHLEALHKMMGDQTNSLPIFLVERDKVVARDSIDVKDLIDQNSKGFANPNCLVVFTKAENIAESTLLKKEKGIHPSLLYWHGKSTIMYVCSIGAIGAKNNKRNWINQEYKEIYDDWKAKYDCNHKELPNYNIIPCNRTMDACVRQEIGNELYATGIPSVEDEINHYVEKYANYKKCVNGRERLVHAMQSAKKQLEIQKESLKDAKKKKVEEQTQKRKKLVDSLVHTDLRKLDGPALSKEYSNQLNEYCYTVLPEITSIWEEAKQSGQRNEFLKKHMQKHVYENLFMPAYFGENGIQKRIVEMLSNNVADYIVAIRNVVTERKGDLSEEAQKELVVLFDNISIPEFTEVDLNGIALFDALAHIPLFKQFFEHKYRESLASNVCRTLRGSKGLLFARIGLFDKICIGLPGAEYTKQARKWQKEHLDKIIKTLDKENYILSQYDACISELESQIVDMEKRLSNLNDVAIDLDSVLKEYSESNDG